MRWWLWWNSKCEFSVYPNMVILDIGTKTCFQMSNRTQNSHIVNSITQFDRDSLQEWIMHPFEGTSSVAAVITDVFQKKKKVNKWFK